MTTNNNQTSTSIANNGINETSDKTFDNTSLTNDMQGDTKDASVDNSNLKPASGNADMSSSSANSQRTSSNNISRSSSNNGGGGSAGDLSSNNNINMNFLHQNNNNAAMRGGGMMNNNSDTDTDTTRRVSKDSLVSRDSLSDLLSKATAGGVGMDQNSLAMLSMLASQQQQQQQMNNNQSFVNKSINQSMGQLLMNNNNHNLAPNIHNPSAMLGMYNNHNHTTMNMNNNLSNTYASSHNNNNNTSLNPSKISKKKNSKKKQTFAQKLMHLLSIKECQSCIRWMSNGMSFCIIDSNELVEKVLPKYFKEAKYASFTRKLNRWGFKHFTLPKTEPVPEGGDREMSIYTHDMFIRDNPDLCNQMDGGSKKRNSSQGDTSSHTGRLPPSHLGSMNSLSGGSSQGGNNSMSIEQLQQQSLLIQQMQQIQREHMMMQLQQQQLGQQQQLSMNNPGVSSQKGSMQSMQGSSIQDPTVQSAINTMVQQQQQQDGTTTSVPNSNSADTSSDWIKGIQDVVGSNRRTSLDMGYMNNPNPNRRTTVHSMGIAGFMNNRRTTVDSIGSFAVDMPIGMRRTSLGFMPYLPASNRRASGFSLGGFSNISNDAGDGMSPPPTTDPTAIPTAVSVKVDTNGADVNTAADDQGKNNTQEGGEGATTSGSLSQEETRHCEAKLAVLEDMIAKEKQKKSLLNNKLDSKSNSNTEAASS